jgi:hypothetical protein
MIKFIFAIALLTPSITQSFKQPVAPKNLTVEAATIDQLFKYCPNVSEQYQMPKSVYDPGASVHLVRINNCLNKKSLMIVAWIGKCEKLERLFSNMVVLHYAKYSAEKNKIKKDFKIKFINNKSQKPLKLQNMNTDSKIWFAFYSLS